MDGTGCVSVVYKDLSAQVGVPCVEPRLGAPIHPHLSSLKPLAMLLTLLQVVPSLALSFTVYETARATALKQQQWLQPQQRQHPPQTPPDTQSSSSSSSRDAASLEEQQMGERQASHALATTSGGSREGGTHRAASSPAGTMTSNTAGVGTSEDSTNMADRSSGSSSGGWWLWGRRPGPVRRALSSGQPLDEGDCIALQVCEKQT